MIRLTFDRDYTEDLQDYHHRNECIREQQYLSPEKLLHLAAFCVSKAATELNGCEEPQPAAPNAEAALDAVRQLLPLFEEGVHADLRSEHFIVNGHTNGEKQDHVRRSTTAEAAMFAEESFFGLRRLRAATGSTIRGLVERLNIGGKTPRI
jgi:hypothetical protein